MLTPEQISELKVGEPLTVAFTCPCPVHRGTTVKFVGPCPGSESHLMCEVYEGDTAMFRVSDLSLPEKKRRQG